MSPHAPDPFGWTGATIDGKYRVEELVGEGGFGVVYRGHHLSFDEPVAIKVLKVSASLQGAERESFLKTFLAEGKLLHRLSRGTAGIVQALDAGAATSPNGAWTPYLILEWLRGATLEQDLLDRRARGAPPRSLGDAIALLEPAARALAAAHAQGVAHRDVKPANLFLAEIAGHTTLKVLDFGIAKVLTEVANITQAMAETGGSIRSFTPQYGAPEQFHRQFGATGPWTDVFALALVLVELVCGKRALEGSDTTQLYILSTDPTLRPTLRAGGAVVDDAVESVLSKALAVDPRARYPEAGAFWDALAAAAGNDAAAGEARAQERSPASSMSREALASMATGEYLDAIAAPAPPSAPAPSLSAQPVTTTRPPTTTAVPVTRSPVTMEAPAPEPPAREGGGETSAPARIAPARYPSRRILVSTGALAGLGAVAALWLLTRPAPPPPVTMAASVTPEPEAAPAPVVVETGYSRAAIKALPDGCPTPSVILATAPVSVGPSYAWNVTRQAFLANPQLRIVSAEPSASGEVHLAPYGYNGTAYALVATCHDGATCNDVAAMYKAIVRSSNPQLTCGKVNGIGGSPIGKFDWSADLQRNLPAAGDTVALCARIDACAIATDRSTPGDPFLECQKAPAKLKTACGTQYPCAAVLTCLGK